MVIAKVVLRTLMLFASGVSIIVLLCIYEIYTGTDLSHPMWNQNYNWLPLLHDIAFVSLGGSVISMVTKRQSSAQGKHVQGTVLKGGYQYGY